MTRYCRCAIISTWTVRKELEVIKPVGGLVGDVPVDGLALARLHERWAYQ